jgi:Icc-related predicted phosphoesterase
MEAETGLLHMRILITSDLHFNRQQLAVLARMAVGFDQVVIAGDLLDLAGHRAIPEQIAEVQVGLAAVRAVAPVVVGSGNHDADGQMPDGEGYAAWVEALAAAGCTADGAGCAVGSDRLTVCPWWNGAGIRARMVAQLERERALVAGRWLWVHHAPPRGSRTAWTRRGNAGDPYLTKLIGSYRPAVVICGHIHEAPFQAEGAWCERIGDTWVFNAGRQPGEVPATIVLDLAAGTAEYRNLEGGQSMDLGWAAPTPA